MSDQIPKINPAKYGLSKTEDGYRVDAKSLLASVGGIQGVIETTLPGFLYVLSYAIFKNLYLSIGLVVSSVVLLTIRHILKKRPLSQLLGSLIGVGLAVFMTLRPGGEAKDYYVQGLVTNAIYGSVLLLSVLVRFPVIGLLVGFLTNQGISWRKDKRKLRFFDFVTLLWVGLFSIRLLVEVPLFLAGDVVTLGFVKVVLGLPFYLTMIWISWLLLRKVVSSPQDGILDK